MNLKKLERYLRVNLLGPGPRLIKKKKNLPGRGLTKVEKHWDRELVAAFREKTADSFFKVKKNSPSSYSSIRLNQI